MDFPLWWKAIPRIGPGRGRLLITGRVAREMVRALISWQQVTGVIGNPHDYVCVHCRQAVAGNHGDGRWRHVSTWSVRCGEHEVIPVPTILQDGEEVIA